MSVSFSLLAVFLSAYGGFMLLAGSMDRHHRQLRPGSAFPAWHMRVMIRTAGWFLLAVSSSLAIHVWGVGNGIAAWFGVATLTAGLLILMLSYRPQWIMLVVLCSLLAGVLLYAVAIGVGL